MKGAQDIARAMGERRATESVRLLVNVDVDDLDKAIGFYCSALALTVGRRLDDSVVELLGGSAPIYLLLKAPSTPASARATERRRYSRHWTPVHLDFVVEEIELAVRRAVAAGAQLEEPIATHEWGHLALLADPFGHGFCFVQFLGRGYDVITG